MKTTIIAVISVTTRTSKTTIISFANQLTRTSQIWCHYTTSLIWLKSTCIQFLSRHRRSVTHYWCRVWGEKFPVMAMELIVKLIFEQVRFVLDQGPPEQDVYTKLGYFAFQPDLGFDEGHLGLFEELSRIIGHIIELAAGKNIAASIGK